MTEQTNHAIAAIPEAARAGMLEGLAAIEARSRQLMEERTRILDAMASERRQLVESARGLCTSLGIEVPEWAAPRKRAAGKAEEPAAPEHPGQMKFPGVE